jgi:nicotinate-nucleotide adenylyltransferase
MSVQRGTALFGGTFDPIHHGHLIAARAVAERLGFQRVVLVPSAQPPHKRGRELTPAADRLAMCGLAISGEPLFEVSDLEIRRPGLSFTILTIEAFRAQVGPDVPLAWIIGGDSLPELHTWYRAGELVEACRIVTAVRPGHETSDLQGLRRVLSAGQIERLLSDVITTPRIDISSTDVRGRLRDGRSVRYLVPDAVIDYAAARDLYR